MAKTKGAQIDQWWKDAIRRVAAKEHDGDPEKRKKLTIVAHKLFDLAMDGDVSAMKEIGDRLDGRPRQAVAGDPEAPLKVEFTWAQPSKG